MASFSKLSVLFSKSTSGEWSLSNATRSIAVNLTDAEHLNGSVIIYVANGGTFNHLKLYLQVSMSPDTPYAPYAMTNQQLTPTDIISDFLTLEEGVTLGSDISASKFGNLIVANIVLKKTGNFTQSAAIKVATIDSKYRPKKNINGVCHFTTSEWDGSAPIGGYLFVNTNGSVNIRQFLETDQVACKFTLTYMVS